MSTQNWNRVSIPPRVRARAHSRWKPDMDCWVSEYSCGSHGYPQIGWKGDSKHFGVLAHRASWEHVNGPVPPGMTLDHLCKNRRCVNPAHLRILSNYENARRTSGRDWPVGQCINGHPASESYVQASGKRVCRPCQHRYQAEYRRRKRKRITTQAAHSSGLLHTA